MPDKKAGDISDLFENPVPDLRWLDVDEKDYQAHERLPEQNLDIVPDLVDLWTHHEKGPVHFVPNIDPERLGKYQWVHDSSDAKELTTLVSRHVKDMIMAGWKPELVAAWVREHVHPQNLHRIVPTLKHLASEQGLLGTVYVDATQWPNCHKGEGKKVAALARHTKFVMGNQKKCADCINNEDGRCSVFRKELIFDAVPYNDGVVKEYAEKLKVPKSAFAALPDPRSKLKAIFAYGGTPTDLLEPVVEAPPPVTSGNQAARDRRAQGLYEPPSTVFVSSADRSLYRDLSQKMMANRGALSDTVKARLAAANSDAIKVLAEEENLLGKVYVRPDQFDDCHKANKFFRRHNVGADYIVAMDKCAGCHFRRADGEGHRCGLMSRKVVDEIPYNHDLLARDLNELVNKGRMSSDVAAEFLDRAARETDLKGLVREAHSYKAPQQDAVYESAEEVVEMGHYASVSDISDQQTGVPLKHRPVVRALYAAMLDGKTGHDLKKAIVEKCGRDEVVAAIDHVTPLVPLAGLMGHVILDPRAFRNAAEAKAHLRAHAMKPKYILAEGCNCGGGACPHQDDHKRHFPHLTLINLGEIGEIEGEFVKERLDKLENQRQITPALAAELRDKVGKADPAMLLRTAYTAPPPAPPTPYRKPRGEPRVDRKKVANELQAATEAARAIANDQVRTAITAALGADQIGQNSAGALLEQVGKRPGDKILASLEIAKLNHLPASTFSQTDVGVQLDQMEATTAAEQAPVTATQKESLRTRVARAMNRGLYGEDLKRWLRNSFSMEVIQAEAANLRAALANQGLVGNYYIDPTPYSRCEEGAAEVKNTTAVYVQAMEKCAGCINKNANGHCSIYRRDVMDEMPYPESREATQQDILRPPKAAVQDPGINPVAEYGVMGGMAPIDLHPESQTAEQDVGFDTTMGELGDI